MQRVMDLRQYKAALRERYRAQRLAMEPEQKARLDRDVAKHFFRLNQYRSCKTVLSYVSTSIEVDTIGIIERSLRQGKQVAVPRCVPGTREMEFYLIHSLDDLSPGAFGVMEPAPAPERLLKDTTDSLCVIPGFCFDLVGYRLGYGKGYYDRFLNRYDGTRVGICYSGNVRNRLRHGRYDCAVELLVTERYIRRINLIEKG